jgi:hypothetical protein
VKALAVETSPRSRGLLLIAGSGVAVILVLTNLPFLVNALSRTVDWFIGLYPHPTRLWEESLWSY